MADTPASDTATLASLNDNSKRRSINQVDIRQAEAEFNQLQRFLSNDDHSQSPKPEHLPKDLEKASDDEIEAEERFDLREYLTSSNDASQAAGIKHKHVGVTWQDLEVTGIGGEDNKESFPSHLSFACPRPLIIPLDLRSDFP
jgi:ATP-binding cassette, subfamily G (WHITE), member 2, SNQ2